MEPPLAHAAPPPVASDRWGGAALALGALAFVVAIVAFVVVYGQPEGTGGEVTLADRVAHYLSRQRAARVMWSVETLAAVALAVAAVALLPRRPARGRVPARLAWATVGVGALFLTTMYPVMIGGYPAAAAAGDLPLFDALNRIATFVFDLGNVVVFLGLAGAFVSEAGPGGVVPRGLALTGAAVCALGAVVGLGMLAGVEALAAAAPIALLGFVLAAYLGLSIWRRG